MEGQKQKSPVAQQDRSRKTLGALLGATLKVLAREGLDGATIPLIAAEAGVAPASVYRRFNDKDDLLRSTFLAFLERTNLSNREQLERALLRRTLSASANRLMVLLFANYRTHPLLMRSFSRFIEREEEKEFRAKANVMVARNIQLIVETLLAHRGEIRRSNPRRALEFAVMQAASAVELIAMDDASVWGVVLPLDDRQLSRELARSFLSYLT